jgi:hypothetical protein
VHANPIEANIKCMTAARKLATYKDLLELPDDQRAEVVLGTLELQPAPAAKHSRAQGALRRVVGGPFDDDDVCFTEHCILRPDLSGWKRARLMDPFSVQPIAVAPDWVCEVVSPGSAVRDRTTKRKVYLEHKVAHYWICDPDARTLEVLRYDAVLHAWVEVGAFSDGDRVRLEPFEAVEIDVARLFIPRG